jgi:hypothetical protein
LHRKTSQPPKGACIAKQVSPLFSDQIDTILDGLRDSVKSKVGSCASAKEIWDKLEDLSAREEAEEEEEEVEENYISNFKEENRVEFF